jgi:aminoglycoside 2''-phosphotransferase
MRLATTLNNPLNSLSSQNEDLYETLCCLVQSFLFVNKTKVKENIQKDYPNFVFESISKIGEGMDSVAFLVNEFFIFRFPKDEETRRNLAKEILALPILRQQLKIETPQFEYIGAENSFVGYKKIEGEFLTKELFYSFSKSEQDKIQKSLAGFLITIHQQNIDEFTKCGIEIQDFRAEYKCDFENVQEYVFPLISIENKEFITKQFHQYLETRENFSCQPVLLHNDFRAEHVLVNTKTKQITGIIDFGDIGIGDADYDLMCLVDDYGEDFVRSLLKFYTHQNQEKLFPKLYFWCLVDILQMIVNYAENKEFNKIEKWHGNLLSWISSMKNRNTI